MYALAQRYAQAGDYTNALAQLGTAIQRQPKQWKKQAGEDPVFAKMREMAEFKRLLASASGSGG